eukprot:8297749-Alexandrium_andersonii.AAC.1
MAWACCDEAPAPPTARQGAPPHGGALDVGGAVGRVLEAGWQEGHPASVDCAASLEPGACVPH